MGRERVVGAFEGIVVVGGGEWDVHIRVVGLL